MEKRRLERQLQKQDFLNLFEDDDSFYEEPVYETVEEPEDIDDDFAKMEKSPSPSEVSEKRPEENIQSSTFTSPDVLEEHSRQLREQVIVYVKKRLYDFEIEMQIIAGNVSSMKKRINILEKQSKDLGEKLTFMDANFNQRAGDLAALKEMAESHQVSIISIMHHLDRKAEAYAVNQKVSRKELTLIEDRVLKLCGITSSEISSMEEKIDASNEKFNFELDKKLFTEEFELRLDFLLHKFKIFENKLKDLSVETPVLDFESIRPVEIKKYVVCKDGTKIKQGRRTVTAWNPKSNADNIIPVLSQYHTDKEVSPKTARQIQKELELTSYRESKRYIDGAYTKIKVGKK